MRRYRAAPASELGTPHRIPVNGPEAEPEPGQAPPAAYAPPPAPPPKVPRALWVVPAVIGAIIITFFAFLGWLLSSGLGLVLRLALVVGAIAGAIYLVRLAGHSLGYPLG